MSVNNSKSTSPRPGCSIFSHDASDEPFLNLTSVHSIKVIIEVQLCRLKNSGVPTEAAIGKIKAAPSDSSIKLHPEQQQEHPAGWETARGGSMTSCKYLSTDLNTLTVVYACWENNLGSKSCYLQWGRILSNILVVNAILREGNILLEGLEFDSFFLRFCLKPEFRSNFGCHFAALFSAGVFLAQVCHCRFFAKVCCSCVLPSPLPGSYIHVHG